MRSIPIDEQMTQVAERTSLSDREKFRQQQSALCRQEQAQKRQHNAETSTADKPLQAAEAPT